VAAGEKEQLGTGSKSNLAGFERIVESRFLVKKPLRVFTAERLIEMTGEHSCPCHFDKSPLAMRRNLEPVKAEIASP